MSKHGKLSLAVKCGCDCTYTNENSDNGNQKATSEYGVSFKQNPPTIILLCNLINSSSPSAIGALRRFTKIISKCLNCNESSCTNEGRGTTQKELWQEKQF